MNETLWDIVAILTGWQAVVPFDCEADVKLGADDVQTFHLHAEPKINSHEVSESATGWTEAFLGVNNAIISSGAPRPYSPLMREWRPFAARLAFPMELPIWGRRGDDYIMTDVITHEGDLIVRLNHKGTYESAGYLRVNPEWGLATELDLPSLNYKYREIKLSMPRLPHVLPGD